MTYGTIHKWHIPFYGKLDSRRPIARILFVCLAVIVGIGFGLFSYWACGFPSAKLQLPVPVIRGKTQASITDDGDGDVSRKIPDNKAGIVENKLVRAPVSEQHENILTDTLSSKDPSETRPSTIEFQPSTTSHQPSSTDRDLESEDEYSRELRTRPLNVSSPSNRHVEISWDDHRLDILHMMKPEFNPKFKNPCWYEPLQQPDPYKDNAYVLYSPSAKGTLATLKQRWKQVYDEEQKPRRLRCLPYFMIIGQPKCGSTDLFWKIDKHPDIDTPPIKELHWWARNRQGRRFSNTRIIPFEDYVDMFDKAAVKIEGRVLNKTRTQVVTGEASVSMLWDNNDWFKFPENRRQREEPTYVIPHYVHHLIPDVKLIVVLRDPVDRMYSDYLYFHSSNKSADNFHGAVEHAISCYRNCTRSHSMRQCVYNMGLTNKARIRLRVGLYSVFLQDWLDVFPRQQFYIMRLEDYSKNTVKYIKEIYNFLEVRDITQAEEELILDSPTSNVRKAKDKQLGGMHEETRKLLKDFYQPFNRDLSKLLQDKKYLWLDKG